jgi:hypothetical protein
MEADHSFYLTYCNVTSHLALNMDHMWDKKQPKISSGYNTTETITSAATNSISQKLNETVAIIASHWISKKRAYVVCITAHIHSYSVDGNMTHALFIMFFFYLPLHPKSPPELWHADCDTHTYHLVMFTLHLIYIVMASEKTNTM